MIDLWIFPVLIYIGILACIFFAKTEEKKELVG